MSASLSGYFGAIKAEWLSAGLRRRSPPVRPRPPFITIARQAGAGGRALARALAERLNRSQAGGPPWRAYDRELLQQVADDPALSTRMIESLEDTSHNWLRYVLEPLVYPNNPSELQVFNRVAATVRALAEAGRAILVGSGGVFITGNLPGGLHIYLVSPLERRIERMREEWQVCREDAARRVAELDANRQSFYRRHFPGQRVVPEAFTVTFNTATAGDEKLVNAAVALLGCGGT